MTAPCSMCSWSVAARSGACVGALLARAARPRPRIARGPAAVRGRAGSMVACSPSRAPVKEFSAPPAPGPILAAACLALRAHARVAPGRGAAAAMRCCSLMRREVGEPNLGYIIETRRITARSWIRSLRPAAADHWRSAWRERGRCVEGRLAVQSSAGELAAQLIVGADGARSAVRTAFGIATRTASYEQTAIVARADSCSAHIRTPPGSASWQAARWRCCRWPTAASPSSGRCAKRRLARLLDAPPARL